MYQDDISGQNAIDNAFKRNSVFCIKAFVDNLLQFADDLKIRNCFDKVVLLMIKKGLDVKQLCNSSLLYPQIWTCHSIFSPCPKPIAVAYNYDLEDLQHFDPMRIFDKEIDI